MRILSAGYKIARANETYISHEVGHASPTWLKTPRRTMNGAWHLERFYSFGHSPQRCYYKARNRILYSRKHWRAIGLKNEGAVQIPQQMILTIAFERDRVPKLRSFLRGIWHGLRTPLKSDTARYL